MRTHDVRVTVTEVDAYLQAGIADPFAGGLSDPFRPSLLRPGQARTIEPVELEVVNDMLELADPFSFSIPFTPAAWDLCRKDAEVQVTIDDSCVLTGYIEDRGKTTSRGGSLIEVRGLDKGGRLAEAAPLKSFVGEDIAGLVLELVSPWFDSVTLSNARNREVIRGSGRKARALAEPALLDFGRHTGKKLTGKSSLTSAMSSKNLRRKVEPDESRAEVILALLEQAGWLAWSAADGSEFFVGLPNYDQEPQWRFFLAGPASARTGEANVTEADYLESLAERFAMVEVCGSGKGNVTSYAAAMRFRGVALDNEETADGTGREFIRPKKLRVSDNDIRNAAEAYARAVREMRLRDSRGQSLEISVPGFGQEYAGASSAGNPFGAPAIFACDTMASFEDEEGPGSGAWMLTRVEFRHNKSSGQTSRLSLVPQGTELRAR